MCGECNWPEDEYKPAISNEKSHLDTKKYGTFVICPICSYFSDEEGKCPICEFLTTNV